MMGRLILVGLTMLALIMVGCDLETEPDSSTPAQEADVAVKETPTPPLRISSKALWAERENNATRFDDTYKGEWVVVYGQVGEVESGDVRLVVNTSMDDYMQGLSDLTQGLGVDMSAPDFGMPLMEYIALQDLPREQQAMPNSGQWFEATCKVEGMTFMSMQLGDCHSGQVIETQ